MATWNSVLTLSQTDGDLIPGADGIKEEYLDTRASDIARGVRPQMRWIRERYNQPTTFV